MATPVKKEKRAEVDIGSIVAEIVPEREMFMTVHYGDGTLGKTKFDASFTMSAMSLLVTVDNQKYLVPMQQIITKVIEHHESKK